MAKPGSGIEFDADRAASQESRAAKLAPMRDSLHLFMRMVLADLADDAHILCVGAGTGPELIDLAIAFPRMRFTAVEPAPAMLDVCRRRADEAGIAARCDFHEGTLETLVSETLAASTPFDAATAILVSQFFLDQTLRRQFFESIAARLKPGGLLINADLAADQTSDTYRDLLRVWTETMRYAGAPLEDIDKLGRDIAVLPTGVIETLISSAGFTPPVLFFQSLLIHAWFAGRAL